MSNLVLIGDFSSPAFYADGFNYYQDFSSTEHSDFSPWGTHTGDNTALLNGNNAFGYPDPSNNLINNSQYVSLQQDASIYQTINIPQTGFYEISFYYTGRPDYDWNALQISFYPSTFTDTLDISYASYDWAFYTNTIFINATGNYDLFFQGTAVPNVDVDIAFTNVNLTYISSLNNPLPPEVGNKKIQDFGFPEFHPSPRSPRAQGLS